MDEEHARLIAEALERASEVPLLDPDERKAIREVLEWWREWKEDRTSVREILVWWRWWQTAGKLVKVVLWFIAALGAAMAALNQLGVVSWFAQANGS